MLNMLDTQDNLKNFSEDQLVREMQAPSGSAPQFMVLGEIERRKRMRADSQRQQGLMQPTVAQEAIAAAGVPQQGIAGVAQSLAPQTDMTQNTGVPNVQAAGLPGQPNQPQRMADGGVLKLAPGGSISSVESLRINHPDVYDRVKNDPSALEFAASYYRDMYETPKQTTLESSEATPSVLNRLRDTLRPPVSNRRRFQQSSSDLGGRTPEEYDLDQRAESLSAQRGYGAEDSIFTEGSPTEYVAGTSGPTPGGIVGESMFDAPFGPIGQGTTFALRNGVPPVDSLDSIALPSAETSPRMALAGLTDSSDFGVVQLPTPLADAPADVSELQDQQARRLYLSERGYDEGDVPAIVDMLNRGREFQQSDTYTPPEQIYDLSPRGRLEYEMDGASPIEKYQEFGRTSDRLYQEGQAATAANEGASFAAQDARSDAQRLADDAIDRRMRRDNTIVPYSGLRATIEALEGRLNPEVNMDTGPYPFPKEGIETLLPPEVSPLAASDDIIALPEDIKPSGGTDTESAPAKGKMDQDKWLALAQAGFVLMSTGDAGKAGQAGLAAYSQSKQAAQDERKLEAELAFMAARTSAANRGGGSGGLSANQLLSRGNDLLKSGQAMLETAGDNADSASEAQAIMAAGRSLIRQAIGGAAPAGPTVTKAPSAT